MRKTCVSSDPKFFQPVTTTNGTFILMACTGVDSCVSHSLKFHDFGLGPRSSALTRQTPSFQVLMTCAIRISRRGTSEITFLSMESKPRLPLHVEVEGRPNHYLTHYGVPLSRTFQSTPAYFPQRISIPRNASIFASYVAPCVLVFILVICVFDPLLGIPFVTSTMSRRSAKL